MRAPPSTISQSALLSTPTLLKSPCLVVKSSEFTMIYLFKHIMFISAKQNLQNSPPYHHGQSLFPPHVPTSLSRPLLLSIGFPSYSNSFWGVIALGRSTMVPRINLNTLYHMNAIGCKIIISPISPFLSDSAHFQPSRMFSASWKLRYLR